MPHAKREDRAKYRREYAKRRISSWKSPEVEHLRQVFTYDPDSGFICAKANGERIGKFITGDYRVVYVFGKWVSEHRVAWAMYHGKWPTDLIDHIDGIPWNNRIANLREATPTKNQANARLRPDNKIGIKGICVSHGKWHSYLYHEGKKVHSERHNSLALAVLARSKAVDQWFGEFAHKSEWSNSSVMQLVKNATLLASYGSTAEEIAAACDCHYLFARQIVERAAQVKR